MGYNNQLYTCNLFIRVDLNSIKTNIGYLISGIVAFCVFIETTFPDIQCVVLSLAVYLTAKKYNLRLLGKNKYRVSYIGYCCFLCVHKNNFPWHTVCCSIPGSVSYSRKITIEDSQLGKNKYRVSYIGYCCFLCVYIETTFPDIQCVLSLAVYLTAGKFKKGLMFLCLSCQDIKSDTMFY